MGPRCCIIAVRLSAGLCPCIPLIVKRVLRVLSAFFCSPMRTNWLEDVEAASAVVGAAVLCSVFAQRSFTQPSGLTSEIVCWSLLPILLTAVERPGTGIPALSDYSNIRGKSIWAIAACLTIACAYEEENGLAEFMVSSTFETREVYS